MSETHSHFVTVCPNCSTKLRVNRKHIGQDVTCKHCEHTFRAGQTNDPIAPSSGEGMAGPSIQAAQPEDRIALTCPSCQATLSVRRIYVGNQVRCKQCGNTFLVSAPAQPQPEPAGTAPPGISAMSSPPGDIKHEIPGTETAHESLRIQHDQLLADREQLQAAHNQLDAEHNRLRTEHERLRTEHEQLRTEHEQLRTEYRQLCEQKDSLTMDLDTIRAGLGTISPAEIRPLAEERDSLRAEVRRLLDQISTFDNLGAEVDRLRRALNVAERTHHDDRDKLTAELAAVTEQHRQLQDRHASIEESCKQYQDRNHELIEAHDRLSSDYQSLLDSGRLRQEQWAEQLRELHAQSDQAARRADLSAPENLTPSSAHQTAAIELEAARVEVEDLKRRLRDLESLNREISDVLSGVGITYKSMNL